MSKPLFKEVSYSLSKLMDDVEMGEIGLPDIQRPFVWKNSKVRDLFDSMYQGYPVGYLLFWETENPPEIKNKAIDTSKLVLTKVILDGQQRLTTLFMIIKGEIPPYYTSEDILNDPRHLYFDVLSDIYKIIYKCESEVLDINSLLDGPICHSGFKRLN